MAVVEKASAGGTKVPLADWVTLHPAALTASAGGASGHREQRGPRSDTLAQVLASRNRNWGNPVDADLVLWCDGADAIVTGQQPGLLGGPLLTLVKACAVAAEVRRRRAAGRPAVGFLWLATGDDDLQEMGWGRVAVGRDLLESSETEWQRGTMLAGAAPLGAACHTLIDRLGEQLVSENARAALDHTARCYTAGALLGEATARFLGPLLAGSGVVIVDALEGEVGKAAGPVVGRILERLPEATAALEDGARAFSQHGWPVPLRVAAQQLPIYRVRGAHRERLAASQRACRPELLREHAAHPERFLPNVWLRPLVQDAALGTTVAVLGGAEFAYHRQAEELWGIGGVIRPEWRLRPHVTVVTAAERRLIAQLRLGPDDLLRAKMPARLLPGKGVRSALRRLNVSVEGSLARLDFAVAEELPALRGDLDSTRRRLASGVEWLADRVEKGSTRVAEVELERWQRLRAFLRPRGRSQERELSILAPLLRLGVGWPELLIQALDPGDPGMHLLFWREGGLW